MGNHYPIVASNYIAGAEAFIKTLAAGTPAVLVREPGNQYDKNAVAIYVDGRKVGYVPKKQNVVLAQFIDQQGKELGMDSSGAIHRQIAGTFIRSPNSGFPMVEV